jgi:hypothetical protein
MRLDLDWFSCLVGFFAFPLLCLFGLAAFAAWMIFTNVKLFPDNDCKSIED